MFDWPVKCHRTVQFACFFKTLKLQPYLPNPHIWVAEPKARLAIFSNKWLRLRLISCPNWKVCVQLNWQAWIDRMTSSQSIGVDLESLYGRIEGQTVSLGPYKQEWCLTGEAHKWLLWCCKGQSSSMGWWETDHNGCCRSSEAARE